MPLASYPMAMLRTRPTNSRTDLANPVLRAAPFTRDTTRQSPPPWNRLTSPNRMLALRLQRYWARPPGMLVRQWLLVRSRPSIPAATVIIAWKLDGSDWTTTLSVLNVMARDVPSIAGVTLIAKINAWNEPVSYLWYCEDEPGNRNNVKGARIYGRTKKEVKQA